MVLIVFISNAERRLPVQYAKRVVGRKMYGGQSSHIPMKVNMSGVMPIIFAQSIASLPATIGVFVGWTTESEGFGGGLMRVFDPTGLLYSVIYFFLILGFSYFYSTMQFNPIEVANNLKKNGGFIPGFRPGKSHRRLHPEGAEQDHPLRRHVPVRHRHRPHRDPEPHRRAETWPSAARPSSSSSASRWRP